jgi:hypothetical protein
MHIEGIETYATWAPEVAFKVFPDHRTMFDELWQFLLRYKFMQSYTEETTMLCSLISDFAPGWLEN